MGSILDVTRTTFTKAKLRLVSLKFLMSHLNNWIITEYSFCWFRYLFHWKYAHEYWNLSINFMKRPLSKMLLNAVTQTHEQPFHRNQGLWYQTSLRNCFLVKGYNMFDRPFLCMIKSWLGLGSFPTKKFPKLDFRKFTARIWERICSVINRDCA